MISKDRSERYQEIEALKFDLSELLPGKSLAGPSLTNDEYFKYLLDFENFKIASKDKTNLLSFKEETISRPEIEKVLFQGYERVKANSVSFVALKGIGKRSLIAQLSDHVRLDGGVLITCKDGTASKNSFLNMIDILSKSILSKTSEDLLLTRNALLQGLGRENLAILIKWEPRIQIIMGAGFTAHTDHEVSFKTALPAFKKFLIVLFSIQKTVLYLSSILVSILFIKR